jgi:hypothetical protein
MKLGSFLVVKSIVSLAFGIGFAVTPAAVWSIYGVTLDSTGVFMTRFVAALLIGVGLICWFTRHSETKTLNSIILSLCICDTIGFVVALCGQLSGIMNTLGWIVVAIWLLLALGLAYFRFVKPGTS